MGKILPTPSLLDSRGFTIVEMLVVVGISGLMGIFLLSQARTQAIATDRQQFNMSIMETEHAILTALSNPVACKRTFGGMNPGPSAIANTEDKVYRADEVTPDTWNLKEILRRNSAFGIGRGTFLRGISVQGEIPGRNTGEMRALFTFEKVTGNETMSVVKQIPLLAKTDGSGKVVFCQTFSNHQFGQKTQLTCKTPASECLVGNDYCNGEFYFSTVVEPNCLCTGTKTTGSNVNGRSCVKAGPSPSPSPLPVGADIRLANTNNAIRVNAKLDSVGRVYYAVYDANPGPITAADLKTAATGPLGGDLVANGFVDVTSVGPYFSSDAPGLPENKTYFVNAIAEVGGVLDGDANMKVYDKVLPQKVSMLTMPMAMTSGRTIRYAVSYPDGYYDLTPAQYVPALLFFHGGGEVAQTAGNPLSDYTSGFFRMSKATIPALVEEGGYMPFVTITPQCNKNDWDCFTWANPGFGNALVALAKSGIHTHINVKKLYLMGSSSGAAGAWATAINHPTDVAAMAVFMTTNYMGTSLDPTEKATVCNTLGANQVPVWAFHNSLDSLTPITNTTKFTSHLTTCNPVAPIMTTYTGNRWPADNDASHPSPAYTSDPVNHDCISYTLGTRYYQYQAGIQYTFNSPIEPAFSAALGSTSATLGTPLGNLWDWMAFYTRP